MELLPVQKQLPKLSPEDSVTHAAADLTEALQNPDLTRPIPHLGEKQTAAMQKLLAVTK